MGFPYCTRPPPEGGGKQRPAHPPQPSSPPPSRDESESACVAEAQVQASRPLPRGAPADQPLAEEPDGEKYERPNDQVKRAECIWKEHLSLLKPGKCIFVPPRYRARQWPTKVNIAYFSAINGVQLPSLHSTRPHIHPNQIGRASCRERV